METKFSVYPLSNNTYRINDKADDNNFSVDAYLLIGSKCAILFDCLLHELNLIEVIESPTSLPVKPLIN